jgi:ATP-binding cassette subfamily B multidrug efflux pump
MLIKLIRTHLRPYRRSLAVIVGLQFLQVLSLLYLPTLNASIIDDGVAQGDTGTILQIGGVMLVVTLVQVAGAVTAVYYGSRTALAVGRDIRDSLFDRIQGFSTQEMSQFGTSSLITRTTNDVQQVQTLAVMALTMMVAAPITIVGSIVLALRQDVPLSGLLVLLAPVLGVFVTIMVSKLRPLFRIAQERLDRVNQVLREQITGVRVIRAFVRDDDERYRFEKSNSELYDVQLATSRYTSLLFPSVLLLFNLTYVGVVWFGGHRIDSGAMEVGALTAFLSYLMLNLMSVMVATFMAMMAPRAEVCAERIQEVLETEPSVVPPATPRAPDVVRGRLELQNVEFRYPGAEEPVLCHIDLVAEPGETTAIVGSTGSGKTSLLNLVPRLFDATGGSVSIDGIDVRDLDPIALARAVGIVPQRPYLFSGTVASNLRYGRPDASDDDLWHALEIAQARPFVEQMTDGLYSEIAQGGTNVSGGQRQRLAIARALVHQPPIYLFDDSFSALDYTTDAALRAALAREITDATVVIVAQRVSTIRHAQRIVVLDEGRIVGSGTHDELMASNATYQEIVLSQLTAEEAAA